MGNFFKQVNIYFRLVKNYQTIAVKKNKYFYIYSMPIFGFFLYLISKIIIKFNNNDMTNFFFEMPIFRASIRFLPPNERSYIANALKSYNTLNNSVTIKIELDSDEKNKLLQLKENGCCSLGKIFSDEECKNFIKYLKNKNCFNSQVPMQSDGKLMNFQLEKDIFSSLAYFVFLPEIISYPPIQNFLNNKKIQLIIDSYLNFNSIIYDCRTWYNPTSKEKHYVHRLHRDHDDYRTLTAFIYWNKITKSNGCLSYVKKSHKFDEANDGEKIYIEGDQGHVFIADLGGLHAGNQVLSDHRYITQIRFGKNDTYAAVIDGYCLTPTAEQLKFLKKY